MRTGARELARRVLARVAGGGYATLVLAGELGKSRLDEPDRTLATELVYGALRWRLRLAAYQILLLRVPSHAAVNDRSNRTKVRKVS